MASWISKKTREKIYRRDNYTCCYCGCKVFVGDKKDTTVNQGTIASLDHIVSQKDLAAASTDDADFSSKRRDPKNLVVVCSSCNSSKGHKSLFVWCNQKGLDYNLIQRRIARRTAKKV